MVSQYLALLVLPVLVSQAPSPVAPRFLESVRVVSVRPAEGEVELATPDGTKLRLREGDALAEEGGAKLKDVAPSMLLFRREVTGGDGEKGESILVVRFDATGKTGCEYRTVGDVRTPDRLDPIPADSEVLRCAGSSSRLPPPPRFRVGGRGPRFLRMKDTSRSSSTTARATTPARRQGN
jgi:hypothetical protein